MSVSADEKRAAFRKLHASGCFVLPNPWDIGSAKLLQTIGFKALASTSAGFAWSLGRPDNRVTRDDVLGHLKALCDATDLPMNADFEGGFARDPEGVAANVTLCVATGVAGLSIEDSTGDRNAPLYERKLAAERIRAARAAIDATGSGVMLVGRCENFFVGQPDLEDTIARLISYAEAGADCLYAPGIKTKEQIVAVVKAVAPKPVNVLLGGPGWTVGQMEEMGVRRISVGGSLARVALDGFIRVSRDIAEKGAFDSLSGGISGLEINKMFAKPKNKD